LVFVLRYYLYSLVYSEVHFTLKDTVWMVVGWWMWILIAPIVLYLARRFPLERGVWARNLGLHVAGWLLVTTLDVSAFTLIKMGVAAWTGAEGAAWPTIFKEAFASTLSIDLLVYGTIVAVVHAVDYRRRYVEHKIAASQLEMQLARARYQALKMQLQPHFLFNTLNTISALMDEDVQASRRVLTLLSDLLRMTLHAGEVHEVPLQREAAFIERYLEIQRARFHNSLETEIDIDPDVCAARVPSLILQPLVENAFKHGMAPLGVVSHVTVRGYREQDDLVLEVVDNGPGLPRKGAFPIIRKGIGLRNTEERLQRLYGIPDPLCIEEVAEGSGVRATIRIPFETDPARMEEAVPA
ncbi:MAG TPA: histidine kinase, partial [Rhodothermales bacterium]|nr:histidine kinase [Rhodothermales bacterium]